MGRPLNKKYFGNRNIGTTSTADTNIGGEGVASYGTIVAGSGWTTAPTVAFSSPTIPTGINAAGTVHYKALSFATTANGTGYNVGDVLEVDTGTAATKARAPVASVVGLNAAPTISDNGTNYDSGDLVTFTNANLSQSMNVRITTAVGGDATVVTIEQQPVWIGTGAAPTTTAGWTATTSEGQVDNNGAGLVLTGLTWGVYAFGTVSVVGDYTVFPSTGASGTLTSISPATGTGAKADITMGLLSIAVTEKGSGYVSVADAAVSFSGSTSAAATAVLTTDSGAVGSATNQENAIRMTAYLVGGSAVDVDIIRQVSGRRYKVTDGTRTGIVSLTSTLADAAGECSVAVTDSEGGEYFATKITAHRVTLTRAGGSGHLYATNQQAPWSFDAPTGIYVQIANA